AGASALMTSIVSLHLDGHGVPYLLGGSPHANGERARWLTEALRPELGPVRVDRSARVARTVPKNEALPHPEMCPPYCDANAVGLMIRPRLPLLFVRTRRGELLPDARTALAYARENDAEFGDALEAMGRCAPAVLDPEVVARYGGRDPLLFRDLGQPYRAFAHGFFVIPIGLCVTTSTGIGTMIGPPLNRPSPLPIETGLIETDWYHR